MAKRLKKLPKFEEFEIENAASTLLAAEKIHGNPKLKAAAIKYIKSEKKVSEKVINNN